MRETAKVAAMRCAQFSRITSSSHSRRFILSGLVVFESARCDASDAPQGQLLASINV